MHYGLTPWKGEATPPLRTLLLHRRYPATFATVKAILKDQYSNFHHRSAGAEPLNKSPSCSSVVGATGVMEGV